METIEPPPLAELHRIRGVLAEEWQGLTNEEIAERIRAEADAFLQEAGIVLPRVASSAPLASRHAEISPRLKPGSGGPRIGGAKRPSDAGGPG